MHSVNSCVRLPFSFTCYEVEPTANSESILQYGALQSCTTYWVHLKTYCQLNQQLSCIPVMPMKQMLFLSLSVGAFLRAKTQKL